MGKVQGTLSSLRDGYEIKDQTQTLEHKVRERTLELEEAYFDALERLARVAEYREDATGEHPKRVGQGAAFLAQALGLPQDQVSLIREAAPLHDLGKIAIPDHILLKPGQLTPEEFEVMKSHATIGAKLLSGGRNPIVQMAEGIALTHHEHWDGTGYPRGLKGDAIPLTGRIVAIVEVFDALTHMRPYRKSWPTEQALAELERCAGTRFDPWCVDAFLTLRADPLACSLLGLRPKVDG